MMWLGPLGGLVPIDCATTLTPSRGPRVVTVETVGGHRRAYRLPRTPARVWDVYVDTTSPLEVDKVAGFAEGAWGEGPFVFVSDEAAALNVLTPGQADFSAPMDVAYVSSGPVVVGGMHLPASAVVSIPSSWRALADYIPVVPGLPVTVSVWAQSVTGAPQFTIVWRSGTALDPTSQTVTGSAGGMWQRLTWTGTPPAGTTAVRIGARASVTALAGPQVSWTPGPVEWAAGRGADSVVVTEHQGTPVYLAGPHYYELSYRIEEVSG